MRKFSVAAAMLASLGFASSAVAESFEDICHRVSEEWGTQGDVGAQCACLAGKAAADGAVDSELRSLADSYSSDAEAYEAASAGTKAALDACSVNS